MKRYTVKNKLGLFIILYLMSCSSPKVIYKPLGMTDKGLPEIHLKETCDLNEFKEYNPFETNNSSDTTALIYLNTPNPWARCFELDRRSLKNLKNYIMMQKGVSIDSSSLKRYTDWGSYGVIVIQRGKTVYLFLHGYEESRIFFKNQLQFINKNEKIFNEIQYLAR